jgi:hypothetical protein
MHRYSTDTSTILLPRRDRDSIVRADVHRQQYRPTADIAIFYINLLEDRPIHEDIDHLATIGAADLFFG